MIRIEIDGVDAYDAMEQMARMLRGHHAYAPQPDLRAVDELLAEKIAEHAPEREYDAPDQLAQENPDVQPAPAPAAEAPKKRGRKPKADPKPETPPAPESNGNISESPEDRTDPQNPEPVDDAATAAADAADEAAETAATKEANGGKLTHDDVRKALGEYVTLYGMAAAQADGPVLIQKVLGDETKSKISDLPDDQAVLQKALDGCREMIERNPFGREKAVA